MSKQVVGDQEDKNSSLKDQDIQDAAKRLVEKSADQSTKNTQISLSDQVKKPFAKGLLVLLIIPVLALCAGVFLLVKHFSTNKYADAFKKTGQEIKVSTKLSTTEHSIKDIPKEGGQLTLGSATLTIPAQKTPLPVTMTKIDELTGLPNGWTLKDAYEFSPDGSVFTDSVKIDIKSSSTKLYAFKINEGRLTRAILKKSADGYTAYTDSFSGIAFIEISGDIPSAAVSNDVGNKAKEIIANIVSENSEEVTPQQNVRIKNVLYAWYQTSVNKHLEQSVKDDSTLKSSITEYLSWLTKVQLFGIEDQLQPQIDSGRSLVTKGLVHAVSKASDGCTNDSDITNASSLLAWQAITQMLGLDNEPGLTQNDFDKKLKNCTDYVLDISSVIKGDDNITLNATIPISMNEDRVFTGKGTATEGPFSNVLCTYNASQTEFPISIGETHFIPKISSNAGVNINLMLNLDDLNANDVTYTCSDGDTYQMTLTMGFPQWSVDFTDMHGPLALRSSDCFDCYLISDWDYVGKDSVIATKTLNGSYSQGQVSITGETKFTLKLKK